MRVDNSVPQWGKTTPVSHQNLSNLEQNSRVEFAQRIATDKSAQCDIQPFMVMDMSSVSAALETWQRYLPSVQPFFSSQCNADPVLLEQLARYPGLEIGFNCITREDVHRALGVTSEPRRLIYSNPCFTRSALNEAKTLGVELLSFETLGDLNRISLHHPDAELVLNIGVGGDDEEVIDRAEELLQLAADLNLRCTGIGLSCFDDEYRVGGYTEALKICRHLFHYGVEKLGLPLHLINLGDVGTSGVRNYRSEGFIAEAMEINASLDAYFPRVNFPSLRVIATPGRFYCEQAFSFVTCITARRCIDASLVTGDDFDSGLDAYLYEINDGVFQTFGCVDVTAKANFHPLFPRSNDAELSGIHRYSIVLGSSLDMEWDLLYKGSCGFSPPTVGDWLIWHNMGAYSINNVSRLEDNENDIPPPHVLYLSSSSQEEWVLTKAVASKAHRSSQYHLQVVVHSENSLSDDGRGSSLGSDHFDGMSSDGEADSPPLSPIEEDIGEERGNWVLDWLQNEFSDQ